MVKYTSMQEHWSHYGPPVYVSVAAYLGMAKERKRRKMKPGAKKADNQDQYGNLNDLVSMFSGGVIV